MGIMVIELVASRVVSKYFGNSLYTWTGIIGVVLGGISLGNYIGGKLADRYRPRDTIPYLLLTASFFVLVILLVDFLLEGILHKSEIFGVTGSMVVKSFLLIFVLFFVPSTCLGTISPVMVKYALEERRRVGNTVGVIYALASMGSIFGTFLSGFLLIPLLGIKTILCLISFAIASLALLVRRARYLTAAWLIVAAVFSVFLARGTFDRWSASHRDDSVQTLYARDSRYSHIKVLQGPYGGRTERVLVMDGLIHNRYNPEDPDDLIYDYEKIYAAVVERWVSLGSARSAFATLTIGGGACQLPAYLGRRYPASRNEIVEIDPEVIHVARRYFDFRPSPRLEITIADARNYVNAVTGGKEYDIVFLDAFNSYSVPTHLTTREFTETLAEILSPDGLVAANVIDIYYLVRFLAAYLATLREVFAHVAVFPNAGFSPAQRSTFVILASRVELPLTFVRNANGSIVTRRLTERAIADLMDRIDPVPLTDDHAPVENMIGPVFVRSVQ